MFNVHTLFDAWGKTFLNKLKSIDTAIKIIICSCYGAAKHPKMACLEISELPIYVVSGDTQSSRAIVCYPAVEARDKEHSDQLLGCIISLPPPPKVYRGLQLPVFGSRALAKTPWGIFKEQVGETCWLPKITGKNRNWNPTWI